MTDQPALTTMVIQANPVPDPVATAEHLDAYQSLLALIDERSGAMDHHTQQADTPTTIPPLPRRSRAAAWAFAAAFILILVVVGAAALLLRSDDAQVTDESPPPTTANVDNSQGETLGPALDTLTWTKTDFTLEQLGASLHLVTFDPEDGFWLWHSGGLWESDDGMSWRYVDVPTEFGDYTVENLEACCPFGEIGASPGFGLASSSQGLHALLSWQDGAWVEVGQFEMPDTVGIDWGLGVWAPIESGGVLTARGDLTGSLPWEEIYGLDDTPRQRWDSATRTVHIVDRRDGSVLASLLVEIAGDTATFRDAATGAVIHEVVGSADYPIDWLMKDIFKGRLLRIRLQVAGTWVGAPGADFELHDRGGLVLAVPDGSGFVAYEFDGGLRTLMSADAVTWSEGNAPPFAHAHPWGVDIHSRSGEIVAVVRSIGQDLDTQFWVSPDGVTWTQKALPANFDNYEFEGRRRQSFGPYPTEFGYVAWPLEGGLLYWLSVDGESWIEAPGPTSQHGRSSTVAGSTLFWADEIDDLGGALWVGHFQP